MGGYAVVGLGVYQYGGGKVIDGSGGGTGKDGGGTEGKKRKTPSK